MQLQWLREIPDSESLRDQWNRLALQMERPEVFYTYQWALAMQRAHIGELVPLIGLAYEGDTLTGVAAMATQDGGTQAGFLSSTTADYCDFISSPENREVLVAATLARLAKMNFSKVTLANLPADSRTAKAIAPAAKRQAYHAFSRPAYLCARVEFQSPEQRREVKRRVLGRKVLRRSLNLLAAGNEIRVVHLRDSAEIRKALPDFSACHVARFVSTQRLSNLIRPRRRRFLEELAQQMSGSGWVILTQLIAAGRPIAWNYGFQFAGSWFWYLPTFESELERHSPGFCLLSQMIAEACDNEDVECFDMGLGGEEYKDRLATSVRETMHVTLHRSAVQYGCEFCRYHGARILQSSHTLEQAARTARECLRTARSLVNTTGFPRFKAAAVQRLRRLWRQEIVFFRYPESDAVQAESKEGLCLKRIDLGVLAKAAMQHADDQETLKYLLGAAAQLRAGAEQFFALVAEDDMPVHFCGIRPLEASPIAERDCLPGKADPQACLIDDCWTPFNLRGRGYFGRAIQLLAQQFRDQGMQVWIASMTCNQICMKGIRHAGFEPQHSLIRRLGVRKLRRDMSPRKNFSRSAIREQTVNLQYERSGHQG